jgi:uncharacterized beta-barrel protein YwiB (DUF1934 family)
MEKITLQIGNKQIYASHEDGYAQEIEATIGERMGSQYILFDQTDEPTGLVTKNMIKIKEGKVEIRRSGALTTTLVFDKNKVFETEYETEYGKMDIKIITKELTAKILQKDVNLEIKYEILMHGKKISDNIYFIRSKNN